MSGLDVTELSTEQLPNRKFPAEPRSDFRLYMAPEVRRGIEEHAHGDVTVEICGVLVGHWLTDENGPYALVTDYIRCENAASKLAEVTFTHDSWAQINKEMDSKFSDARIVGWYHSHPDFGIFLSDRDCFIHEHFFSSPGQVAYVVDPVRELEGMFAWRNGKPMPLPHFWVGNRIRTVEASERNPAAEMTAAAHSSDTYAAQRREPTQLGMSTFGLAATALGMLALFYLGYLYGHWQSSWERQMIVEGAIARFGDANRLLRFGMEDDLATVRTRLGLLVDELDKLPDTSGELSKEQIKQSTEKRKVIRDNLLMCAAKLSEVEQEFGLSTEDRLVIANIVAKKQAELRRKLEATLRGKEKAKSAEGAPKSTSPKSADPATLGTTQDKATPLPAQQPPAAKNDTPKQ
jgi:proteasome lid subunit RPN8/RPN11